MYWWVVDLVMGEVDGREGRAAVGQCRRGEARGGFPVLAVLVFVVLVR